MLIDKDEAIRVICKVCYAQESGDYKECKYYPCDDVQALEALPSTDTDLISRADAIDAVRVCDVFLAYQGDKIANNIDGFVDSIVEQMRDNISRAVSALPSAELVLQTPQTYGKSINPSNAEVVSDYISRADAIEAVTDIQDGSGQRYYLAVSLVDKIRSLPSAEAVQGWIPCSERLPKMIEVTHYGETYRMSECVLVTGTLEYQDFDTYNTSIFVGNCFDDMNGSDIYWYQNEDRIINVTAWMPLPTPYKGGEK